MDEPRHPEGDGDWTLLQGFVERSLWQQDVTDGAGAGLTRFWLVAPGETLMYDTFDEAEDMFRRLDED